MNTNALGYKGTEVGKGQGGQVPALFWKFESSGIIQT